VIFATASFCIEIEVKAGVQALSVAEFDSKIQAINSVLLLPGYTGKSGRSTSCFGAEAAVNYSMGETGIKVGPKIKLLPNINFTGNYFYPDNTRSADYTSSVMFMFLGTGAVYQLMLNQNIGLYAGADFGYQLGFATDKIIYYDAAGNVSDSKTTSPSTSGFGYYIKFGAKYYFTPGFGILAEVNYNNIGDSVYGGAGLIFAIGEKDNTKIPDKGAYLKLVQFGNAMFASKNFVKASGYYLSALKYKKDAVIYKYLGHCFYYTKQFAKARWCYEHSLEISENAQLRMLFTKLKAGGF
jgi:hypothetical protein